MNLPDLGVGIVWLPGLESAIDAIAPAWDLLEVEPQAFWLSAKCRGVVGDDAFRLNRAAFDLLSAYRRPVLVHSVGYAVGSVEPADRRNVRALHETFSRLNPPWWSEHASLSVAGRGDAKHPLGLLLPPVQSLPMAKQIAGNICRLQDEFGLPFAFETGVNYLHPLAGELSDGDFWAEIAERADCGVLLDLHNVWTNARNGRQPVEEVVERLPLGRVWEMHLAAGQAYKGYWLDAHSGPPPDELLALARSVVGQLPALRALIFEMIPDYLMAARLSPPDLARCLGSLRDIWAQRGSDIRIARSREAHAGSTVGTVGSSDLPLPDPGTWELRLRKSVDRSAAIAVDALDDPGVEIYRDLIDMVRRGTISEALPLTTRYLLLAHGEVAFDGLLQAYWRKHAPEPFMADEARGFAEFLKGRDLLPHLDELLALELAAHRAAVTGETQCVRFTCDPSGLVGALKRGDLPGPLPDLEVEAEVTPPDEGRTGTGKNGSPFRRPGQKL